MKIVSDSSSNLFSLEGADYSTVPMKIIAGEREFVDVPGVDIPEMVGFLKEYKGRSGSSCANVQEWLEAFEGESDAFGITISSNLSGSFSAAKQAAEEFMEAHPGRKAHIFDSLSAGPEMAMIGEKLREAIREGLDFDAVRERVCRYFDHTHTIFCLESMMNLARNGRVNPAVAKIAGMLGIRVVGEAQNGQLAPLHKPRGEKKALQTMVELMAERGFHEGAAVRIAHCLAQRQAMALGELIQARFPGARCTIEPTTALCSYYAEAGGLIVAFEGGYNGQNHY